MDLKLNNKKVLITGSSKGIGLGLSKSFLEEGCSVVINGSSNKNLNKALKILPKNNVFSICKDVTTQKGADSTLKFAVNKLSKIDILICNLGSGTTKDKSPNNFNEWKRMFDINFWSTVIIIEKSLKFLSKTKGKIICISSICANKNIKNSPISYSVAKAALNKYATFRSSELAKLGIRLNIISPGNILFAGSAWEKKIKSDFTKTKKIINTEVPMQRFGNINEISNLALFLASDKSNFITGSNIIIDGGQSTI